MSRERFAMTVIGCHTLAALLHGAAHGALDVPIRGTADAVLIASTVYLGPLGALVMLARGWPTRAALVLLPSMSAALAYGLAFHFLLATPDNVSLVARTGWGAVFGWTAVLIAVLECVGVVAAVSLLRLFHRGASHDHRLQRLIAAAIGVAAARGNWLK